MKCSDILNDVFTYLGYHHIEKDEKLNTLIEEAFLEVVELSQFKYIYAYKTTPLPFMDNNTIYQNFLRGCNGYYLVLTTLGKRIDDRCKYYSKIDTMKMCIFDAVSNAYLEAMADAFEKEKFKEIHTYRFCPGYQGTSTDVLKDIFDELKGNSIGIFLKESMLMVPLKSMCGIIGVGKEMKKSCGACVLLEKCAYRKDGKRCY